MENFIFCVVVDPDLVSAQKQNICNCIRGNGGLFYKELKKVDNYLKIDQLT